MQDYKPLATKMSQDVAVATEYIKKRKAGELPSAKTPWKQFNDAFLEGLPWGTIMTIVSPSGSGKSTMVEEIKYHILDDKKIKCLSFELDMTISNQIIRRVCKHTGLTSKQVKHVKGFEMSSDDEARVQTELDAIAKMNIWNVGTSVTADTFKQEVLYFIAANRMVENKESLIVTIDYITMLKGKNSDDKKRIVDDLYEAMVEMKNSLTRIGFNILFIPLSQTNREVFNADRIKNKAAHYPVPSDIFQSSNIFNNSDFVIMSIVPSKIRGIDAYGPYNLPLHQHLTGLPYLYTHIMKNREGANDMLTFIADFKHFTLKETYV